MIQKNLKEILSQLPAEVTLVAVSKTKPIEMIQEAYEVGQLDFGENRPQELQEKAENLPKDIRWHMIGHLQTNKVKYIIEHVDLIHSIDSIKLLKEVDKRAGRNDRKVDCLLQVHIASEEHKFGFTADDIKAFFQEKKAEDFSNVRIVGLMGMATFTDEQEQVRKEFRLLKVLYDYLLEEKLVNNLIFNKISMGMSGDYSIAIEEGSTMVRIGSSIFGNR